MKLQAGKYLTLAFFLIGLSFLFLSCSVQKRKYNKGFYVQHKHHKEKPSKIEKEKNELYCSAKTNLVLAESNTEYKELLFSETIQISKTHKLFKPKALLNKIALLPGKESKSAENNIPDNPNKNAKYKVSIFQINVMGLVSVCLIPVMVLAFFIPGAAILVWATLIIGALLALLCAFMIQKRPGAWMAGLAMGLWGLILLYFILLFFVF